MIKGALKLVGIIFLLVYLSACSGGGSGGVGATTGTVTGTVTDSALLPVANATVTVQGGTATTQTDAAGRYTLSGLVGATNLTFTGPSANFFPTAASVTVVVGGTTALDIFLTRAEGVDVTIDGSLSTPVASPTHINAVQQSILTLEEVDLVDAAAAAYIGNATVYVAPIDVGKEGHGLANYQSNLNNVFTAALTELTSASSSLELFAAAAVAIEDDAIPTNPLALDAATSTSTLTLPIPSFPTEIRANAMANYTTADLWYYDETIGALVKHPTLTATIDAGGTFYTAIIDRTGVWMAGAEDVAPETITGTLRFSNLTAAAGATIYAVGDDHGFTNITSTDAAGAFSLTAKSGSDLTLHFVVYANSAQWPHEVSLTTLDAATAAMDSVDLPFTPPASGLTITIDNNLVPAARLGPDQLGFIFSSGRQIRDDSDAALNVADVTFLANATAIPSGEITMTPTLSGCGIQEVVGQTFASLTTQPGGVYFYNTDPDPANFTIADLETATLPILVAVEIPADKSDPLGPNKHYAKISIDSVVKVNPLGTTWNVNFRHAFSLTDTF